MRGMPQPTVLAVKNEWCNAKDYQGKGEMVRHTRKAQVHQKIQI